jgi:hypothetical protein
LIVIAAAIAVYLTGTVHVTPTHSGISHDSRMMSGVQPKCQNDQLLMQNMSLK